MLFCEEFTLKTLSLQKKTYKAMKHIRTILLLLVLSTMVVQAQNVQLHYDFGYSLYSELGTRPNVTTTVEMFKADRWGQNYFFVVPSGRSNAAFYCLAPK